MNTLYTNENIADGGNSYWYDLPQNGTYWGTTIYADVTKVYVFFSKKSNCMDCNY